MSLARNTASGIGKTIASLAAAAGILALANAPAIAGTVVASSGPSSSIYPVGKQIGDTQRIRLRSGDRLTVLDRGRTRILRGPGTIILAQNSQRTNNNAFSSLTQRTQSRARTGATRGGPEDISNPNIWYVDVASSGKICLNDASSVLFWRAGTAAETNISVASSDGASSTLNFPEKEMLAEWAQDISTDGNVTYSVSGTELEGTTQLSFVMLENVPEDAEGLALALIENECTIQLEQMSSALSGEDAGTPAP